MATTLFLRTAAPTTHRGTDTGGLTATGGWRPQALATTRGASLASATANTVAGPTTGVEVINAGDNAEWLSDPVSADVTISGTITANIWASESSMNANVAINVIIDILRADSVGADGSNAVVQIVKSTRTTEVAITTNAVNNFTTGMTSGAYTAQTLHRGDRLRIRVFGDDAGTMGSGFTFTVGYNGATGGANGDSFVTLTETLAFESLAPAGTVIYPTDTASDVATASVDREMWTSRGAGVQNDVTNTATGFRVPIQVTDTAGGTVVDWFTKKLAAVTLSGVVKGNIRCLESSGSANASLRGELAIVDEVGANAVTWSTWCIHPTSAGGNSELGVAETAEILYFSGDDYAIPDGSRIRLRLYCEDHQEVPLVTGFTITTFYAGTSGGASGDTFLTFPITLTEYVPPDPNVAVFRKEAIVQAPEGSRTQRRWA